LQITTKPLAALPLAVLSMSSAVHTYAFPNLIGKWQLNQCATDAAHFLVQVLIDHHAADIGRALSPSQQQTLQASMRHQLCLLRQIRSCLPDATALMAAYAQVCSSRLAFLTGRGTSALKASRTCLILSTTW
jgi:hypothetical protein